MIDDVFTGNKSAARDIVILNGGAGIYVSGITDSLAGGIELAGDSIDSGKASAARDAYVRATQCQTNNV